MTVPRNRRLLCPETSGLSRVVAAGAPAGRCRWSFAGCFAGEGDELQELNQKPNSELLERL